MYLETLYAKSLEELDRLVDEFTTGRITYDVNYKHVGISWQADILYDYIIRKNGEIEFSDKVR